MFLDCVVDAARDTPTVAEITCAYPNLIRGLCQSALATLFLLGRLEAAPLTVQTDFEGGSATVMGIDQEMRLISFTPGGDPARGWPCWWYFRVDGVTPGETITVRVAGSEAVVGKPGAPIEKPLSPSWAMPQRATFSGDGINWAQTAEGRREDKWMIYPLVVEGESVLVAWGPPYTPSAASAFVREAARRSPHAEAGELCRSREGRSVPVLRVREGDLAENERFGVWVQARQHAWECGSSWVAQGFMEWILGESADAAWLRRHATVEVVPIMDVDNAATGNGGKDAQPHDHNRDWSGEPHWNEVRAAQAVIRGMIAQGRMDVFLDLHNPAPGDPTFFYILDDNLLKAPMIELRDQFIELAYGRISGIKPMIPMSNTPKTTGPSYHPRWREISGNWVSMNANPHTVGLCLETIWNSPRSTPDGYRAVGAALAAAVREYLSKRPAPVTGR